MQVLSIDLEPQGLGWIVKFAAECRLTWLAGNAGVETAVFLGT